MNSTSGSGTHQVVVLAGSVAEGVVDLLEGAVYFILGEVRGAATEYLVSFSDDLVNGHASEDSGTDFHVSELEVGSTHVDVFAVEGNVHFSCSQASSEGGSKSSAVVDANIVAEDTGEAELEAVDSTRAREAHRDPGYILSGLAIDQGGDKLLGVVADLGAFPDLRRSVSKLEDDFVVGVVVQVEDTKAFNADRTVKVEIDDTTSGVVIGIVNEAVVVVVGDALSEDDNVAKGFVVQASGVGATVTDARATEGDVRRTEVRIATSRIAGVEDDDIAGAVIVVAVAGDAQADLVVLIGHKSTCGEGVDIVVADTSIGIEVNFEAGRRSKAGADAGIGILKLASRVNKVVGQDFAAFGGKEVVDCAGRREVQGIATVVAAELQAVREDSGEELVAEVSGRAVLATETVCTLVISGEVPGAYFRSSARNVAHGSLEGAGGVHGGLIAIVPVGIVQPDFVFRTSNESVGISEEGVDLSNGQLGNNHFAGAEVGNRLEERPGVYDRIDVVNDPLSIDDRYTVGAKLKIGSLTDKGFSFPNIPTKGKRVINGQKVVSLLVLAIHDFNLRSPGGRGARDHIGAVLIEGERFGTATDHRKILVRA